MTKIEENLETILIQTGHNIERIFADKKLNKESAYTVLKTRNELALNTLKLSQEPPRSAEITKDYIDFKDKIIEEYKNGNIVYLGAGGAEVIKLDDLLSQPVEGILYDLNRSEIIILTFINDPKWVNDFAMCKVVRELYKRSQFKEQPAINEESLLHAIERFKKDAIKYQKAWVFPDEHYIKIDGIIMAIDQILDWIGSGVKYQFVKKEQINRL